MRIKSFLKLVEIQTKVASVVPFFRITSYNVCYTKLLRGATRICTPLLIWQKEVKAMNRITEKFNELKSKNKTAFIGYVTAGDPSIQKTAEIVLALEKGGADIIEIGIPYSDPLADGPVIQNAGLRSFAGGFKVAQIFECA